MQLIFSAGSIPAVVISGLLALVSLDAMLDPQRFSIAIVIALMAVSLWREIAAKQSELEH